MRADIRTLGRNDLMAVADIHLRAFADRALATLGREAVRRYYEWQLEGPHDAVALGLFVDRVLAAYCFAGRYRGALSGFLRRNWRYLMWRVVTHLWLLSGNPFRDRLGLAWRALTSRRQPAHSLKSEEAYFGVLAIAVDPRMQGNHLGRELMLAVEEIAAQRGFKHLRLTVALDNDHAIGFYKGMGWERIAAADGKWRGLMTKDVGSLRL